eukprot:7128514-Pyramimonas_sp.AAC.1
MDVGGLSSFAHPTAEGERGLSSFAHPTAKGERGLSSLPPACFETRRGEFEAAGAGDPRRVPAVRREAKAQAQPDVPARPLGPRRRPKPA